MRITRLHVALAAALLASLALNWGTRADPSGPGLEFAPNMAHSPRYAAFAPNPNFADGKTLQAPEPGTIPRGFPPLHYDATPASAIRAGEELTSPIAASDSAALARGATVFANFCQPCHGVAGRGDGTVTQRGFPPPPSLLAQHAIDLRDGQIFHILTFGQGNMAAYASQVSREDRWKVIRYIRSLQPAAAAPAGATQ